ncbi:MAG: hypothetical protein ACRDR6_20795 [Pseudonocardiaceae bacterium]
MATFSVIGGSENSHQPTRQREQAMKKFTSPGGAQRFLSAFCGISPHFRPRRHPAPTPPKRRALARKTSPRCGRSLATLASDQAGDLVLAAVHAMTARITGLGGHPGEHRNVTHPRPP